tara:strand:+ start:2330 stop:3610 length:1281 start_codon:yes stop_codon:yes gene_type:complete
VILADDDGTGAGLRAAERDATRFHIEGRRVWMRGVVFANIVVTDRQSGDSRFSSSVCWAIFAEKWEIHLGDIGLKSLRKSYETKAPDNRPKRKRFCLSLGLGFLAAVVLSGYASAGEVTGRKAVGQYENISLAVSSGVDYVRGQQISYSFDVPSDDQLKPDDTSEMIAVSGSVGYRVPAESFLGNSLFGARPSLVLGIGKANDDDTEIFRNRGPVANSQPLGVSGKIESTTIPGIQRAEARIETDTLAVGFSLVGDLGDGWSLAPRAGLHYRNIEQTYILNADFVGAPPTRLVFDTELEGDMAGVSLGIAFGSPHWRGFRLLAGGELGGYVAHSKHTAVQDPNSGIVNYSDITEIDKRNHLVGSFGLSAGTELRYGLFSLTAMVRGNFIHGAPQIRMPTKIGERAGVDTANNLWSVGGLLTATLAF